MADPNVDLNSSCLAKDKELRSKCLGLKGPTFIYDWLRPMTGRGKGLVFVLILVLVSIAFLRVCPVFANVPSVDVPVPWTRQSDSHTILNITVHHDTTAQPFSDHYISQVEVDIDGVPNTIPLTNSPPQPQFVFTIQHDMGLVSDTPTVQAKAFCTYHLWGPSSPSVQVPEFSVIPLFPILAIASIAILLLRSKMSGLKKSL